MKKRPHQPADATELRRRAEVRLKRRRPGGGARGADADAARLIHELQVHQIELEMQNEELQQTRASVEALAAEYTDLYDFAPTGYFSLDREGGILRGNLSGTRLLGVERSRLAKQRFVTFVAKSDRPAFGAFLQKVFANPDKECCEVKLLNAGHPALFVRIEAIASEAGHECRMAVLDISDRKRNEEALRSLSRRLQEMEASERNEISRELHDRIGHGLTSLSLMVGTLDTRLPRESRSAVEAELKEMQALIRSMVTRMREVMAELRPPVLDDYGLLAALRHEVTGFTDRTGIAVNLSGVEPYPRLPSSVETAMFRISQEALSNILKHAHAKQVAISLNPVADRVVLDIADDGAGFATGNTTGGGEQLGMITMRGRAAAVGITLRLESAPGAGTRVVLEAERAAS